MQPDRREMSAVTAPAHKKTVAIVGGGFSGAAVAFHLARAGVSAEILVFEPRARLGGGLAYGGDDPHLRINVPARIMSLVPDDADHFVRWLETGDVLSSDPDAFVGADAYPRRREFGLYVEATLKPHVASGAVTHIQERVVSLRKEHEVWRLATGTRVVHADLVVIATTHPACALPAELKPFADDPRVIADPFVDGAVRSVPGDARVLIVGAGLTGADLVAALDAQGHRGPIVMMSRRGLRARGGDPDNHPPEGDFFNPPLSSATALLAAVRAAVRAAEAAGRDWHPVFERLRNDGQAIWRQLSPDARARLVRHLRPYWDAHRFRAAPQVEAASDRRLLTGALVIKRARLGKITSASSGLEVELRERAGPFRQTFDRILVAVGPSHRAVLESQPFLRELAAAGHLALDAPGLGLATSAEGAAIDRSSAPDPTLLIAGPLARGTFGELMGVPQVAPYAQFVAERVAAALKSPSASDPTACRA